MRECGEGTASRIVEEERRDVMMIAVDVEVANVCAGGSEHGAEGQTIVRREIGRVWGRDCLERPRVVRWTRFDVARFGFAALYRG